MYTDYDIERIKSIIEEMSSRYRSREGAVALAGIEDGIVKIAPSGFCWQ